MLKFVYWVILRMHFLFGCGVSLVLGTSFTFWKLRFSGRYFYALEQKLLFSGLSFSGLSFSDFSFARLVLLRSPYWRVKKIAVILTAFVGLGAVGVAVNASTSPVVQQPHIQVTLISDVNQAVKGQSFTVGIALDSDPHWHVYWRNPGDSGLAPTVKWTLPDGVTAGEILWPYPEKIPVGPLANYGYHHRVVLPVTINVPKDYSASTVAVTARASWLVCKESCVPGKAALSIRIPLGERAVRSDEAREIEAAMAKVPKKITLLGGSVTVHEQAVFLELYTKNAVFNGVSHVAFFPVDESVFEYSATPSSHWRGNVFKLSQQQSSIFQRLPSNISGVLVLDHKSALEFTISQ